MTRFEPDQYGGWWYVEHDRSRRTGTRRRSAGMFTCKFCEHQFLGVNRSVKRSGPICPDCAPLRWWSTAGRPLGSKRVTSRGYVLVKTLNGWRQEHRLVVEEALGRPLGRHETVHHIDGDRQNNRADNLQVRLGSHGQGQMASCGDCGSSNVTYQPLDATVADLAASRRPRSLATSRGGGSL